MKKVKWEYEIQEMKEENYEIYHGTIVMLAGTIKTKCHSFHLKLDIRNFISYFKTLFLQKSGLKSGLLFNPAKPEKAVYHF